MKGLSSFAFSTLNSTPPITLGVALALESNRHTSTHNICPVSAILAVECDFRRLLAFEDLSTPD